MPGRLGTVPSAHSRSLASVRFLPQTRTPLHVGANCGRPHRGSNRALTTGTSVGFRRLYPLGHGGDLIRGLNQLRTFIRVIVSALLRVIAGDLWLTAIAGDLWVAHTSWTDCPDSKIYISFKLQFMYLKIIWLFQKFKFQSFYYIDPLTLFSFAWRDPWDHFLFLFDFLEITYNIWFIMKWQEKIREVLFLWMSFFRPALQIVPPTAVIVVWVGESVNMRSRSVNRHEACRDLASGDWLTSEVRSMARTLRLSDLWGQVHDPKITKSRFRQ